MSKSLFKDFPDVNEALVTGAEFSPCRTWRYSLWRIWRPLGPYATKLIAFIGLNPSTADEAVNDPTIRRCIGFAKAWGYDGMYMLNAFAFRATDPDVMKAHPEPVGTANNDAIIRWTSRSDCVVACWGNHGAHLNRDKAIHRIARVGMFCFGLTKTGQPKHPLYLPAAAELVPYERPAP